MYRCKPKKQSISCRNGPTFYQDLSLEAYTRKKLKKQGIVTDIRHSLSSEGKCTCGNTALFTNPSLCFDCVGNRNRKCNLGNSNLYWIKNSFMCISHIKKREDDTVVATCSDSLPSFISILTVKTKVVSLFTTKLLLLKEMIEIEDITSHISSNMIVLCDLCNLYK